MFVTFLKCWGSSSAPQPYRFHHLYMRNYIGYTSYKSITRSTVIRIHYVHALNSARTIAIICYLTLSISMYMLRAYLQPAQTSNYCPRDQKGVTSFTQYILYQHLFTVHNFVEHPMQSIWAMVIISEHSYDDDEMNYNDESTSL